jgi:hypothetical protein
VIRYIRDFAVAQRTRDNPGGRPQLPYVVAVDDDGLRELLGVRTHAAAREQLERLEVMGLLVPGSDRPKRWVRLGNGTRRRMFVIQGNAESIRRALRADRFDNPRPSKGTRVGLVHW